jgi:hypothetical protein
MAEAGEVKPLAVKAAGAEGSKISVDISGCAVS